MSEIKFTFEETTDVDDTCTIEHEGTHQDENKAFKAQFQPNENFNAPNGFDEAEDFNEGAIALNIETGNAFSESDNMAISSMPANNFADNQSYISFEDDGEYEDGCEGDSSEDPISFADDFETPDTFSLDSEDAVSSEGEGRNLKVRLDKWLWAARFYKTRALARAAVESGRILYNGQPTNPSLEIEVGCTINIIFGKRNQKQLVIRGLSTRRRNANEANELYTEIKVPSYMQNNTFGVPSNNHNPYRRRHKSPFSKKADSRYSSSASSNQNSSYNPSYNSRSHNNSQSHSHSPYSSNRGISHSFYQDNNHGNSYKGSHSGSNAHYDNSPYKNHRGYGSSRYSENNHRYNDDYNYNSSHANSHNSGSNWYNNNYNNGGSSNYYDKGNYRNNSNNSYDNYSSADAQQKRRGTRFLRGKKGQENLNGNVGHNYSNNYHSQHSQYNKPYNNQSSYKKNNNHYNSSYENSVFEDYYLNDEND